MTRHPTGVTKIPCALALLQCCLLQAGSPPWLPWCDTEHRELSGSRSFGQLLCSGVTPQPAAGHEWGGQGLRRAGEGDNRFCPVLPGLPRGWEVDTTLHGGFYFIK